MGWLSDFLFGKPEPEKDPTDVLLERIEKACHKPVKKHAREYKAAEALEEVLGLMDPERIADAAIHSCRKVTRLVVDHLQAQVAELAQACRLPAARLPGAGRMADAIENRLMGRLAPLGEAITAYAPCYQHLCASYGQAWDGLANKALAWGAAGGALGRIFGPLGQAFGMVAGGWMAGSDTGRRVSADAERTEQVFLRTCRVWEDCMLKLHREALDILREYYGRLEEAGQTAKSPRALPASGGASSARPPR